MNIRLLSFILILLLSSLASSDAYGQKQFLAGININENLYPNQIELNNLNFGATFEIRFTKHSGGETGIFYHADRITNIISHSDASGNYSYSSTVSLQYIQVPVLYKYFSRILNFTVGPAFDFYAGWKEKRNELPYPIQSVSVHPKVRIGFLAKVSKSFPLNDKFIIEPEIRFGSVQSFDEANLGIGMTGKYRF